MAAMKRVVVGVLVVGFVGFALWVECHNDANVEGDVRDGMTCVLGKRPVPLDQIRTRLDDMARAMKEKDRPQWPTACARPFWHASRHAEGGYAGQLASVARSVEGGNLDEIAGSMQFLYDHEDWSRAE